MKSFKRHRQTFPVRWCPHCTHPAVGVYQPRNLTSSEIFLRRSVGHQVNQRIRKSVRRERSVGCNGPTGCLATPETLIRSVDEMRLHN